MRKNDRPLHYEMSYDKLSTAELDLMVLPGANKFHTAMVEFAKSQRGNLRLKSIDDTPLVQYAVISAGSRHDAAFVRIGEQITNVDPINIIARKVGGVSKYTGKDIATEDVSVEKILEVHMPIKNTGMFTFLMEKFDYWFVVSKTMYMLYFAAGSVIYCATIPRGINAEKQGNQTRGGETKSNNPLPKQTTSGVGTALSRRLERRRRLRGTQGDDA